MFHSALSRFKAVNCSKCADQSVAPQRLTRIPLPCSEDDLSVYNPAEYGRMNFNQKGDRQMKTYTITRVSGTPDWSAIPKTEFTETYRHTLEETPIRAWAQVAYNDEALLIRLQATEPNIRRELTGLLDEICHDSCLEFFVRPMEDDLRYFNIEYNINCCRYLGFGSNRYDLVRLLPAGDNDAFGAVSKETSDGWEITYQIPYHFIRRFFPDFDPAPGKAMRVNCYKCGGKTVRPHWLSWNRLPFSDNKLDFHSPEHYGRMIFG